eukprot:gene8657-9538_t
MVSAEELADQINGQGSIVRDLKSAKADKAQIDAALKKLLELKAQFKELTGKDFVAPAPAAPVAPAPAAEKRVKANKDETNKKAAKKETPAPPSSATTLESYGDKQLLVLGENPRENLKVALLAVVSKEEVTLVDKKLVSGKVVQFPALVRPQSNVAIFGSTAVAKYLSRNLADYSKKDEEVDRLLVFEELVLSPLIAKKADLKATLSVLEASAISWPLAKFFLYPALKEALSSSALLEAHPNLSGLLKSVTNEVLFPAEGLAGIQGPPLPPPTKAALPTIDWESAGLISSLRAVFTAALQAAFPADLLGLESSLITANVIRCNNPAFGDFQCNNAMALAKAFKTNSRYNGPLSPSAIAERIIQCLPENPLIASAVAAPNGFINIHVSVQTMVESLSAVVQKGILPPALAKRRVLVDFSSPNIAKEMHVGHLRSTIIGDCICRLLEFVDFEVLRTNHVGDWGTQFGMLITYLLEAYPNILDIADRYAAGETVEAYAADSLADTEVINITNLTGIYKASKKKFDEDLNNFKERSRLNVVALQSGDPTCNKIWKLLCDISRIEFEKVYKLLDVDIKEVGESFYNPYIPHVIDELEKQGLVFEDQGMKVIKLPHFTIPLILRKSDGGYGYDSTDMAALKYRMFAIDRDWIIILTDAGQNTHFEMCFDAANTAGWVDNDRNIIYQPVSPPLTGTVDPANPYVIRNDIRKRCRLDHIGFGVVCGEDGKRFKTRSSDTVRLIDLLNAARDKMYDSLMDRVKEGKSTFVVTPNDDPEYKDPELLAAASCIGYGAVKYFDLKQHPSTNYIFNYDRMLDTKGDTAVYLMFAYVRLVSILRKAEQERGLQMATIISEAQSVLTLDHPAERALAFELLQFGDVIKSILQDLLPNRLCDYFKELSVKFTDFVTRCHVLNAPEEKLTKSRLVLCEATRRALEKVFYLLGIKPLEKL